ncbi:MAG TPA: MBL fold metallo-hydrolase, partial [Woeseiaceae bacterium]
MPESWRRFLVGTVLLLTAAVHGQRPARQSYAALLPPGQARVVDGIKILNVRNDVYALFGAGGNITVLPFPGGVTLIDSGLEANADRVLAAIRTITDQPITYIINTHDHP